MHIVSKPLKDLLVAQVGGISVKRADHEKGCNRNNNKNAARQKQINDVSFCHSA